MLFRPLVLLSIVFVALAALAQDVSSARQEMMGGFPSMISGTVYDATGHPINGARVEIQDLMTGRSVASTYTFANGTFEFTDLRSSQYELVASSGVSQVRSRLDSSAGSQELSLQLPATQVATDGVGSTSSVSLSQMKVPGKARKAFRMAMDAFRLSHLDDAFSLVQKALGMYPDYAQALTLRGVLNLKKGDTKSAQPDLEKAVELDYSDETSYVALAALYNTEGKYKEALRVLDRGLSLHPNSWQGLVEEVRAQLGSSNFEDALKTIIRAENFVPADIHYCQLFKAQALAGMKNYAASATEIEGFLQKEPNGPNSEVARKMLSKLRATVAVEAKK
jgi:tetratricopeptide (TPR) repeat protein